MDMSEKLQLIAENMQRVYDAGFKNGGGGGITPSGSITITENGTHDVTEYAEAVVDVPAPQPTGSITITENGTHNVGGYAEAVVNVPQNSGGGDAWLDTYRDGLFEVTMMPPSSAVFDKTFKGLTSLTTATLVNVTPDVSFNETFEGCTSLTRVYVYGQIGQNGFDVSDCPLESAKVIMDGIIYMLANKTGDTSGTQWVCTLGPKNLNKLSATQQAVATDMGWTLA